MGCVADQHRLTPLGTDTCTTRETNKLKPTQAQTVIAAAILRHLHAVITTGQAWNADIATHGTQPHTSADIAA